MAVVVRISRRPAGIAKLHLERWVNNGARFELNAAQYRDKQRQKRAGATVMNMDRGQDGIRPPRTRKMVADLVYMPANTKEI